MARFWRTQIKNMCPKPTSSFFAILIAQCSLLVLAGVGVPAAATQGAPGAPPPGFQLPPAPSPTATPQVQGPVDIEGPVPVTPRVIPTSRPSPTPTPAPTQRPLPTILTPAPQPTADTRRFTPAARATPGQRIPGSDSVSGTELPSDSLDLTPAEPVLESLPSPTSLPSLADSGAASPAQAGGANSGLSANWSLWLAIFAGLIALIAGLYLLRSRQRMAAAGVAPIEPPLIRQPSPAPRPATAPEPAAIPQPGQLPDAAPVPAMAGSGSGQAQSLSLDLTPAKLSRSMRNATLSCAIKLHNGTGQEFHNLQISGDLVTAHSKVPVGDQLADASTDLAPLDTIAALAAGETGEFSVSLNLPVMQIRPIAQGRATLYVPLVRLRVTSDGHDPVTRTFVIGMQPPGSEKVQPFRLDEMPQTYHQIGSRALL